MTCRESEPLICSTAATFEGWDLEFDFHKTQMTKSRLCELGNAEMEKYELGSLCFSFSD